MKGWLAGIRMWARGDRPENSVLEAALRKQRPSLDPPPSLHSTIMTAVRASQVSPAVGSARNPWFWFALPAGIAVTAIGAWYLSLVTDTSLTSDESITPVSAALDVGNKFARELPATVVDPLSEELERLDQDLDRAGEIILASLP